MASLLQKVHKIFPIFFEFFERIPIALHYLLDGLDILLQLVIVIILSSDGSFQIIKIGISCAEFEGSCFNASDYFTHFFDLLEGSHGSLNYIR